MINKCQFKNLIKKIHLESSGNLLYINLPQTWFMLLIDSAKIKETAIQKMQFPMVVCVRAK